MVPYSTELDSWCYPIEWTWTAREKIASKTFQTTHGLDCRQPRHLHGGVSGSGSRGFATFHEEIQITTFTADAEALLNALVSAGQWVWTIGHQLFTGSLRHSMQRLHYQRYLVNRDTKRQRHAAEPRWIRNSAALMVSSTHAKQRRSFRARGRLVNHLYDWMAHESNLAKRTTEHLQPTAPCVVQQLHRLTLTRSASTTGPWRWIQISNDTCCCGTWPYCSLPHTCQSWWHTNLNGGGFANTCEECGTMNQNGFKSPTLR